MNKTTIWTIIISLTLVLGLAGAIALVRTGQDTRSSASFSTGSLALLPSTNSVKVGEEFVVHFRIQNTTAKVNVLQTVACYDSSKVALQKDKVTYGADFQKDILQDLTVDGKTCVGVVVHNTAGITGVTIEPASLTFKALAVGSGKIDILGGDKTLVGGVNPVAGSSDVGVAMDPIIGADYTIAAATTAPTCNAAGTCPTQCGQAATTVADGNCGSKQCAATAACPSNTKFLNFKMSFRGVTAASVCANDWPVSVIVLSAGTTRVYDNIALTKTSEVNSKGYLVYQGRVPLTGVQLPANDVAVFVKGPEHLQMKYGIDAQTSFYNKSAGELNVSDDPNDGKIYNFSNYPLMAGDVTGTINDSQDGLVDGRDFNYVKDKSIKRPLVGDGQYLLGDFDGSCQINNADVVTLMLSLSEKQAQLY